MKCGNKQNFSHPTWPPPMPPFMKTSVSHEAALPLCCLMRYPLTHDTHEMVHGLGSRQSTPNGLTHIQLECIQSTRVHMIPYQAVGGRVEATPPTPPRVNRHSGLRGSIPAIVHRPGQYAQGWSQVSPVSGWEGLH